MEWWKGSFRIKYWPESRLFVIHQSIQVKSVFICLYVKEYIRIYVKEIHWSYLRQDNSLISSLWRFSWQRCEYRCLEQEFQLGAPCVSMNESMAVEDELERSWRWRQDCRFIMQDWNSSGKIVIHLNQISWTETKTGWAVEPKNSSMN